MPDNPNPTEDLGYAFVNKICANANAIWRRLSEKDVGIDGIIELRRIDGASAYVGVQVKSGNSYLGRHNDIGYRVHIGQNIKRLYEYTVPVILVIYDPEEDAGYYTGIRDWVEDNPDWETSGTLTVPKNSLFNEAAIERLRADVKAIRTPKMDRETVRGFLVINSKMTYLGFVELVKNAINKTSFSCRRGIEYIEYLLECGLLRYEDAGEGGPGYWTVTEKGEEYIKFMLGDRYFIPFLLMKPEMEITDKYVDMCMDFEQYLKKTKRRDA